MQARADDPLANSDQARTGETFLGFLEATPDAVVIVDGSGTIAHVNRHAEKLFGYAAVELIGCRIETLMPERFRDAHVPARERYSADPESRPMGSGLALLGLRKDGAEFPVDVAISPFRTERGTYMVSAIRDMTAHRRLEDELRQRTCALEEADRQKDNFIAAVAHELRSPLSVLSNVVHVLRSRPTDPSVQLRTTDLLERQTAHMVRMVEDLLDISRVRRGAVTLRADEVDVWIVLSRAVELVKPLVDQRGQHLELAPLREPLRVRGDSGRLIQVISNLLTNAAKFTSPGGLIWLSAGEEDRMAVIRVRDNGRGIPKEMLPRVFDLFTQVETEGATHAGGLGIGLDLVRRLVELHDGTVEGHSAGTGQGSEFVVRLPVLHDRSAAGPSIGRNRTGNAAQQRLDVGTPCGPIPGIRADQ